MNFELREEAARPQVPLPEPDFARWRSEDGEVLASFHRLAEDYVVRFIDRADFLIALASGTVTCWPTPGNRRAMRDLYLNQVLPVIAAHHGKLVIHASGVAIGGDAVAFVGATGRGKSTLAAAFARAGWPFLSDDGLYLEPARNGFLASPNQPSFPLWLDSEAEVVRGEASPYEWEQIEKARIEADENLPFQREALPLKALYFLGPGDAAEPAISAFSEREALAELINHSYLLDVEDRAQIKQHFETLARLAGTVPSHRLDYPREFDRLPRVIAAVSEHILKAGELC